MQHNTPDTLDDRYTTVGTRQRHNPKLIPTDNLCGVLLSRMGPYHKLDKFPIPFSSIFEALMMIDPQAAIVPSNCDPAKAIGLSVLLRTAQDYKTMMDITLVHWGKPSDRRGRLALSFYVSSAVLTPDLALLKTSCHFRDAIKKAKFTLSNHNLLQTESKALAYFSGKTPQHTWRKDLYTRFQQYLDLYMQDNGAVANIFGEDEQVPRAMPFYLKAMTVKSTNHTASVIAIYVGKLHHGYMSTLITKASFKDIELVPLSPR